MNLSEKIEYLQAKLNLSNKDFENRFKVKNIVFKKLKNNSLDFDLKEIEFMCANLNFDVQDFINEESVLDSTQLMKDKHICKTFITEHSDDALLDDYHHEDNARYEEKD